MKKKNNTFRILSLILVAVLLAAMLLATVSCDNNTNADIDGTNAESGEENPLRKSTFIFEVVFSDGTVQNYTVETTKVTVGEALQEKGLISGEEGPYGLYVKTVCGATYDYEADGLYWAFYINNEMAMTGVDKTDVVDGAKYSFKVEK